MKNNGNIYKKIDRNYVDNKYFEAYTFGQFTLKNRFIVPPMCTYKAIQGQVNNHHLVHYGSLATGGAAMVIVEATAVESCGRISDNCLILDETTTLKGFEKLAKMIKLANCVPCIQLNHAGRKSMVTNSTPVAPSKIVFDENSFEPHELTHNQIIEIAKKFAMSAKLATDAGFKFIELHAAHGYLIHQFMSPITNKRLDKFKSPHEFLDLIIQEIRQLTTIHIILRVSATDYVEGGLTANEVIDVINYVKDEICLVHVSTGGNISNAEIAVFPGYQLDYATVIKNFTNLPVITVGLMHSVEMIEYCFKNDKADFIAIGRKCLDNPFYINRLHE